MLAKFSKQIKTRQAKFTGGRLLGLCIWDEAWAEIEVGGVFFQPTGQQFIRLAADRGDRTAHQLDLVPHLDTSQSSELTHAPKKAVFDLVRRRPCAPT